MATEQVQNDTIYELPLHTLLAVAPDISWQNPPVITANLAPTEVCQIIGNWYVSCSSETHRSSQGQFFTPQTLARYMAKHAGILTKHVAVLDPGAGVGMLASAVCEVALQQQVSHIFISAYESDPILHILCTFTLNYARDMLQMYGIDVSIEVHRSDFVEAMAEQFTQVSLWAKDTQPQRPPDLVILNPPYFKVNQQDPRAKLVKDIAQGRTNMYTMFMSLAASALRVGGQFVSITPRSFASGAYFQQFRQQFFSTITPDLIHIFDSRRSAFEDNDILQENIVLCGTKKAADSVDIPYVTISRSHGLHDLAHALIQQVKRQLIIDDKEQDPMLYLPMSDIDVHLLQAFARWKNYLATYRLEISTGPVVPFRHIDALTTLENVSLGKAVPLIWLQHVRRMKITWPLSKFAKQQAVLCQASHKLLVNNGTQIVLRRFSAKEELHRITAAVLREGTFGTEFIALENHLNYIYRPQGTLSYAEAVGLAAFLNSSLVDRYFRIASGNTQVSATELRKLPLPPKENIVGIGEQIIDKQAEEDSEASEQIIMDVLKQDLIVGNEDEDIQIPILKDSRILMGKIQEAQRILQDLGLPSAQQNEISALTLLALCDLAETSPWAEISQKPITIHNMMGFMKHYYGRTYAENTREVVRRQVIHQFEQARLVDRNPDDHLRPTNSPNTCYALTSEAFNVLTQFGTSGWETALSSFIAQFGALVEQYQKSRQAVALPLKLAEGSQFYLTPGRHNELQIAIVEIFGPRYAPGSLVLYLDDAASKFVIYETARLEQLGVPITTHDKLPDVILYQAEKNWLYLVEAVTSHGPVSHKRKYELEKLLQNCTAEQIYVTAFLHSKEFGRHATKIAWETEVWIAETPEHMIHYNGDRFSGPYKRADDADQ